MNFQSIIAVLFALSMLIPILQIRAVSAAELTPVVAVELRAESVAVR